MTMIALPQDVLCLKTDLSFPLSHRRVINEMCDRIALVGLLNPLVVTKTKGRYLVIDGKKRLHAIKKLARKKKLPRTLHTVPCVLSDSDPISVPSEKPLLWSDIELVHEILHSTDKGGSESSIQAKFDCSHNFVKQALSLKKLHPKLMQAFTHSTINFAQAAALATIPNPQAQWDLLVQLGPFASKPEIVGAIAEGQTVLELPNGEVLLLPSRDATTLLKPAVSYSVAA